MKYTVKKKIVIIFLTFNSDKIISKSLKSAKKVTNDIVIVDSYSKDKTVEICKRHNSKIFYRKFKNYSDQRNWIINKLTKKYTWQLHLDADEILDNKAINSINHCLKKSKFEAYLIKRKDYFLKIKLNFSGLNPWHLRLFKSNKAFCEDKLYDQHFITSVPTGKLNGFMHDINHMSLSKWKKQHLIWSKLEAKNNFNNISNKKILKGDFNLDQRTRTRFFKNYYYKFPIKIRVYLLFLYRLIFKLAFLDGKIGVLFCYYQAFWFRMRVDEEIQDIIKSKKL
jgi:hypothetical protein|tara:strand:- start:215 stop:1057 length:843 start_codon:yes stop_codon:yes gene_type:complete